MDRIKMKNKPNHKWSRVGLLHLLLVVEKVTKGIGSWERNLIVGDWVWGIMIIVIDITIDLTTIIITIMLLWINAHW